MTSHRGMLMVKAPNGRGEDPQLSPPHKVLVVVEEVIAALTPGSGVYAGVLPWLRGS